MSCVATIIHSEDKEFVRLVLSKSLTENDKDEMLSKVQRLLKDGFRKISLDFRDVKNSDINRSGIRILIAMHSDIQRYLGSVQEEEGLILENLEHELKIRLYDMRLHELFKIR